MARTRVRLCGRARNLAREQVDPASAMDSRHGDRERYEISTFVLHVDRFTRFDGSWRELATRTRGDEFILALVRAETESAERVLANLRRSPDELPGDRLPPRDGVALEDHALYWARAMDRNQWLALVPPEGGTLAGSADALRRHGLVQTLLALGRGIDAKNRFTGGHSQRVAEYAVALARSLGFEPYRIEMVRLAAELHDIGKIGVSDSILLKDTALNLEDEAEAERHSEMGRAMLAAAGLPEVGRWIRHVHERFDGRGYPERLAGRQIPVESRLLHAADALDKMTRPHSYRRHRPLREAMAELAFGAGTRLDPELAQRLIQLVQGGDLKIPGHEAVGRGVRRPASHRVRGGMLRY
jgi:HD-GYP domain-containing protein (c-di-GMP phosphodiesterase class II)